jgi:large subunit ribosomal protein L18
MAKWVKITGRGRRHKIIRRKISGTSDRPRMCVYRSLNNLYVQLVNDEKHITILSLSTGSPNIKDKIKKDAGNIKGAGILGGAIAEACKAKGITKVVFDRSGYLYHGRIKMLAEAARKGGLQF